MVTMIRVYSVSCNIEFNKLYDWYVPILYNAISVSTSMMTDVIYTIYCNIRLSMHDN